MKAALEAELQEAERRAIDALGRYKYMNFGYWAASWVHLNKVGGFRRPSPFRKLVNLAREMR